MASLLTSTRVAGLLYLVVIVGAGFAEVVRTSMIESGDATATAENIRDAEWLLRLGFSSDVIAFSADIALALVLYVLLKPVNATLSLLAAFFRLAQASVLGINLIFQFLALLLLSGDDYLRAFTGDQIDSLVYLSLEAHSYGYLIGLVFFGLSNLVLGYLVLKSGFLPALLGLGLMVLVSSGYLIDSFASFLGNKEEAVSLIVIAPAAIVELAFAGWLLIKGGASEAPANAAAA